VFFYDNDVLEMHNPLFLISDKLSIISHRNVLFFDICSRQHNHTAAPPQQNQYYRSCLAHPSKVLLHACQYSCCCFTEKTSQSSSPQTKTAATAVEIVVVWFLCIIRVQSLYSWITQKSGLFTGRPTCHFSNHGNLIFTILMHGRIS